MCDADLECRRLAPAWKLVTIVLNNALSFDCWVVPSEALASFAQELDEMVDALMPMFVGQDRLEHFSINRMRLFRNAGGFDVTPTLFRSPMAFSRTQCGKIDWTTGDKNFGTRTEMHKKS